MVQIGAHSRRNRQNGQPAGDSTGGPDVQAAGDAKPTGAADVTWPALVAAPTEPDRSLSPSGASWWPDLPSPGDSPPAPEPAELRAAPGPSGSALALGSSGFFGSAGQLSRGLPVAELVHTGTASGAPSGFTSAGPAPTMADFAPPASPPWYAAIAQPEADDRPAGRPPGRRLTTVLGVAAAVVVLLGGAGIWYLTQKPGSAQVARDTAARHGNTAPSKAPETVVSTTPAAGSTGVNGAAQVSVAFSEPLSPSSPMPVFKTAIRGTWQRHGATAIFQPARGFRPHTTVKLIIPGGSGGVQSTGGRVLAATQTVTFGTGKLSRIRMEQLLAQLGYLPLTWAPTAGTAAPLSDPNAQLSAAYSPPAGTYTWQAGYPSQLRRLWRPDAPSEVLKGAVMAFEADHGLLLDGVVGPAVWRAMFRALTKGQRNTHGYSYALMRQRLPEKLTVWHNGTVIFRHLANTGISIRPTAVETDPVYIRLRYQIMRGRNPDGSKYHDPVWWVAYFHNGEAIHYFPRPGYGWPQSLGCIELSYNEAKSLWPYLTFGTLVTVEAP